MFLLLTTSPARAGTVWADAGGPYSAIAEASVTLDGTGSTASGDCDALDYAWDTPDGLLDDDGSATPLFTAAGVDGPQTVEIDLAVEADCSSGEEEDSDTATVEVANADPEISALVVQEAATEGESVALSVRYTDAEVADTHTISWDLGDDTSDVSSSISHFWADDGVFTISVTVTDDDTGEATDSTKITIENAPPTLEGEPDTEVVEGEQYLFAPGVSDPGLEDTHDWSGSFPEGVELDPSTGALSWWTTWADAGEHAFTLTVEDDDGGVDSLKWSVTVVTLDEDGDGMSDGWEAENGLDPSDPTDAGADPDGDGISNLDEYAGGTDPNSPDGADTGGTSTTTGGTSGASGGTSGSTTGGTTDTARPDSGLPFDTDLVVAPTLCGCATARAPGAALWVGLFGLLTRARRRERAVCGSP